MNTAIISLIFSGVMMLVGVVTFIISVTRNLKEETSESTKEMSDLQSGIMKANMKLDQVCSTTNDIKLDVKDINKRLYDYGERIAVLENTLGLKKEDIK